MRIRCLPDGDAGFTLRVRALVGELLDLPLEPARVARIERTIRTAYPGAVIRPIRDPDGTPTLLVERPASPASPAPVAGPAAPPARGDGPPGREDPPGAPRVLILDPDAERAARLERALAAAGWSAEVERDLAAAAAHLDGDPPAAVVVALGTIGAFGSELLRGVRAATGRPVLAMGERGETALELLALELGADDFVPAPRALEVLAARLAALERRTPQDRRGPLAWRELVVDPERRSVRWRGAPVELTRTEFDLLVVLLAGDGRVIARSTILERVWGDPDADPRVLETAVHRLRQRLAACGVDDPVETVRGVGHRLAPALGDGVAPRERPSTA